MKDEMETFTNKSDYEWTLMLRIMKSFLIVQLFLFKGKNDWTVQISEEESWWINTSISSWKFKQTQAYSNVL